MAELDFQTLVDNMVRDDTGKVTTDHRDEAIALTVSRYSKDRPDIKVQDVVADGSNFLDLPAAWEVDFSEVRGIEYPTGNAPPTMLDIGSYSLYTSPTDTKIMLLNAITSGQSARINFTINHVLAGATDTIPLKDREAFASWAASILLNQLASIFSGDSDSTIQADSVNHGSKAAEYTARANKLRTHYFQELGINPKRNVAAGVIVDLDKADSQGNDRLLHGRRFR